MSRSTLAAVGRLCVRVGSSESVAVLGGVRSAHSGAAASGLGKGDAGDHRATSQDTAFVKARRAYQAELHELRKTFTKDVSKAQSQRKDKFEAARSAHNQKVWSEKALRDAAKADRAAANVVEHEAFVLAKVRIGSKPGHAETLITWGGESFV
jgi:hypothetical protein